MSKIFTKPKRTVNRVFLHCSDSNNPKHDNPQTIAKWHLEGGFNEIGYHFVITKNGQIHEGRSLEKIPAAQAGHNTNSIAICLTGRDDFSEHQCKSLIELCQKINQSYNGNITFHGHCEVSNKLCPVFDYKAILGLENGKITPNKKENIWMRFLKELLKILQN